MASVTAAQASSGRVGVLRSTDTASAGLTDQVDAALLRDLRAIAGIEDPMVSPVDYAEIQLSVGCSDESRACLETIARAASVSALLVRTLRTAEDGSVRLELRYFDSASTDPPAAVTGEVAAGASDALVATVPRLVRELFGIPEVAAPAAADPPLHQAALPTAARDEASGPSVLPWIVIGAGAAVLTAGIVVGAIAASDYDAWKQRPVGSMAEADRANAELDELETRALVANVLIPVGVVAAGVGVALLVLDGSDDEPRERRARVDVEPVAGGALLSVRTPW